MLIGKKFRIRASNDMSFILDQQNSATMSKFCILQELLEDKEDIAINKN